MSPEEEFADFARRQQAAKRRAEADAALDGLPLGPHNGTTTSKAAASSLKTADADRWRVLQYIVDCGDRGATRDELVIHFNATDKPMGGDTIRPRVWECMKPAEVLEKFGVSEPLLTAPGHKRKTQKGRESLVLVATLAGIQMVHRHQQEVARAA